MTFSRSKINMCRSSRLPKAHLETFEELLQRASSYPRQFWTKERMEELSDVHLQGKVGRAFYSGKSPLQPLTFELSHQKIEAKRWRHPFLGVQELLPNLSAAHPTFICSTESEEKALAAKITIPPHAKFVRGYLSSGIAFADSTTRPHPHGRVHPPNTTAPQQMAQHLPHARRRIPRTGAGRSRRPFP